jgi:nicotinate-nucleotide adenylyltransferase
MADYEDRLALARRVVRHPRIRVSDLERGLGTRYTADTVAALGRRFSGTRFVWLIGADNLAQLPRWRRWTRIFHIVPIAIFDRPTYSLRALAGSAAQRFGAHRLPARAAKTIVEARPPAWVFLHTRLNPVSATTIRKRRRGAG